ncbi:unnamed protein product [Cercopithifilaria johnstoni]|uniref:Uncharacterized protein n=1 Tax=Cercopithifilaria johnstoni TaxID=2874296 RepID=A0A8J2Q9K2_9BILA|nr:unnamed protein product [Cercopithifilaria johnstoni]
MKGVGSLMILIMVIFIDISYLCAAEEFVDLMEIDTIPHRFECFSCMSLSYQERWEHLQYIYTAPKMFTNRCNEPQLSNHIPTVVCSTMCANLLEPDVEAGVFIGFKFIRGCLDRVLRNGFNETAVKTHRFQTVNQCRSLPRAHLYNLDRRQLYPVFGDVQLCTCYGDRCNGSSDTTNNSNYSILLLLTSFTVLLRI